MRLTFEGEHRCGKGTQIGLCASSMRDPIIVRGDGSYQGGLEGVVPAEEIAFRKSLNHKLYDSGDSSGLLWGIAATACAATITSDTLSSRNLLIDRGPLSRASYLLSSGYVGQNLLDNMYPEFHYVDVDKDVDEHRNKIDIKDVDFGSIVYMQVPTQILLARVEPEDPKADFRRQNIIAKQGLFEKAIDTMPLEIQEIIYVVDGSKSPVDVLAQYDYLLK